MSTVAARLPGPIQHAPDGWNDARLKAGFSDKATRIKSALINLDVVRILITNISNRYPRLKEGDQSKILQIIAKRIIVNPQ
jgi:hypothetical protein